MSLNRTFRKRKLICDLLIGLAIKKISQYVEFACRKKSQPFTHSFSATNYKNCSFVISGKHLKLQWIKGLKRLSFKPFFLSVEILQHAYKITKQNLL